MSRKDGGPENREPRKPREPRSLQDVTFHISADAISQLPDDRRVEVALVGRSNVGKSSLVNLLAGRKNLAKSSSAPGKTRTFNYYDVGGKWYLVDLPGFGYAKMSQVERARWERLIVEYLQGRDTLRLVLHLIDSRHSPAEIDQAIFDLVRGGWVPYGVVLTKADKLSGNERAKSQSRVRKALKERGMETAVILTSATDRRGKLELIEWIESLVGDQM